MTDGRRIEVLEALEKRVLWLASWTIHHANHLRPKRDGLKVGGHQASSASVATLMTALYFDVLGEHDRVAVKPHAAPVYHAIQYLLGRQTREKLEAFRALGGAQSYPSRTKDGEGVDFSTGSVGLGVGATLFAALAQDYLRLKGLGGEPGRMIALVGDAELDEGNIFEALLEGWKHDVRNLWWVIDYNRQSLDSIVEDRLYQRIDSLFESMGWRVVTLKYGRALQAAFERRGGDALRDWIDGCSNSRYSALVFKGGAGWREQLRNDIGDVSGVRELLDEHDDPSLHALMTNLGGHDMASVLDAFHGVEDDRPTCFLAYTIKGRGLPFEGHQDNHAGLMSPAQMESFRGQLGIGPGQEWEPLAGLDGGAAEVRRALDETRRRLGEKRRLTARPVPVPDALATPHGNPTSTQEGFGRLLREIARRHPDLADRMVTTSPDVTVSTNLGGWVNARGVFDRRERTDLFQDEELRSAQSWTASPAGQHIELGIAENNLFLLLSGLGLSHSLFGERLLPVGTLYDPFILRGLDALKYACYQDARFLLVATPSGLSLAPEGGAHQSLITPLIGLGQPGLRAYEPAYTDELAAILSHAFSYLQAEDGGSVYLRLSTRVLQQPEREMDAELRSRILRGAYWCTPPEPGADLALVYCGAVSPEARGALERIRRDAPGAGLLAVTSADVLHQEWRARGPESWIAELLSELAPSPRLATIIDGHPATLSWLGSVCGGRVEALGVDRFGESGDIPDLYAMHGLDQENIEAAGRRLLALEIPARAAAESARAGSDGRAAPSEAACDLTQLARLREHLEKVEPAAGLGLDAFLVRAAALAWLDVRGSDAGAVDVGLLDDGPEVAVVRRASERRVAEIALDLRDPGTRGPDPPPLVVVTSPAGGSPAGNSSLRVCLSANAPGAARLSADPPTPEGTRLVAGIARRLEDPIGLML